ncbi:CAP domain-containing protein [Streptomyces sp. Vc74B-19]|uniref:CAP domain-containing protein n=1 Tax=unclassified Streptomyces TaxID=2593676 RepID=UPI001BFC3A23|nr:MULTISPECIES: CAP domain-containing protein [unclassified Streptomyces]MBT3163131.1 CAP domain-containing protein [Streptomyces sp. Vc74B-19]MCO4698662.1 CAP domain-containing protein [Streptomyces sp. RO-S4]
MGRHRRSDAGRAATSRDAGVTHHDGFFGEGQDPLAAGTDGPPTMGTAPYLNPEAYAETYARSEAYLYATEGASSRAGGTGFPRGGFPDGASAPAPAPAPEHRPGPAAYAYAGDTAGHPPVGGAFPGPRTAEYDFAAHSFAADPLPDLDVTPRRRPVRTAQTSSVGADDRPGSGHRRKKKKAATPVRTGLLGVSAAVALGTVAVATGAVPGLENYKLGGDRSSSDEVQAGGVATNLPTEQGGTSGSVETPSRDAGAPASRDGGRSVSPKPSTPAPSTPTAPTKAPEKAPEKTESAAAPERTEEKAPARKATPEPERKAGNQGKGPVSAEVAAGAEVLRLVNAERAKVGCSPVTSDNALAALATAFSDDMADRGFFDHTDPDGDTPWDRAQAAGIANLGGENIARGQADAEAVMEAWMNSPGHKANILNCDFKTLGVGVHMGPGGPWWTQNFGY